MVAVDDQIRQHSSLVRWRTAFWAAVATTPLVAGVLGAFVALWLDGQSHLTAKVVAVFAAIAIANVLAWRCPRASGIALGSTAPLLAVGLYWVVALGVMAVTE